MILGGDKSLKELKFVASGGLGDCLLVTPFLRCLARSGRYRRVVCAVPQAAAEIFDRNPYIDQLIPCAGRDLFLWALPERDAEVFSPYMRVEAPAEIAPDMKVRAQSLHRPNQADISVFQQLAEYFEIYPDDYSLDIYTEASDAVWAENQVARLGGRPFVVINRETSLKEKTYPDALWQSVVDLLHRKFTVVEFTAERSPLKCVHLVSPLPGIRSSAELLRRAACSITVESFLGHLATAVGTSAVVLFGPTNPRAYGHPANKNLRSEKCAPCEDTKRLSECSRRTCMSDISPQEIVDAAEACINGTCQKAQLIPRDPIVTVGNVTQSK